MRRYRATPEGYAKQKAAQAASYAKNGARLQREAHARRDLFQRAARRFSHVTADDLRGIWEAQGGHCALTGRALDGTAHLDHQLPLARGGTHDLTNLRWVTKEANLAKRDLLDVEFLALCRDVIKMEEV